MSLTRLIINSDLSAAGFKSVCDLAPLQLPAANNFVDYLSGLTGGNYMGLLSFKVGAVQAAGLPLHTQCYPGLRHGDLTYLRYGTGHQAPWPSSRDAYTQPRPV